MDRRTLAAFVLVCSGVVAGCATRQPEQRADSPEPGYVYVLGLVGERGRFPVVDGRTPFTLVKLVAICGDFSDRADRSRVRIVRQADTGRMITVVNFDDIIEGKRPDFELQAGDVIYVPAQAL